MKPLSFVYTFYSNIFQMDLKAFTNMSKLWTNFFVFTKSFEKFTEPIHLLLYLLIIIIILLIIPQKL